MTKKEQIASLSVTIGTASLILCLVGGLLMQDWLSGGVGVGMQIVYWSIYFSGKQHEKDKSKKKSGKKIKERKPHFITKLLNKFKDWLDD